MENYTEAANYSYSGYSGKGFVEISTIKNTTLSIPVTVSQDGEYSIDFRYANGNGPTNTENKCAVRTLKVDDVKVGTTLFPQRGKDEWSNWGYSNSTRIHLTKGRHTLTLHYEGSNENMNGDVNEAMLDYLRIIQITN